MDKNKEQIIKSYHDLVSEHKHHSEQAWKLFETVAKRNKTLAKLLLLKMASCNLFSDKEWDWDKFQAERGKKEHMDMPLKAIMDVLGVTHRTAQDYQRTRKALYHIDAWFDTKIKATSYSILALQEFSPKELSALYTHGKI